MVLGCFEINSMRCRIASNRRIRQNPYHFPCLPDRSDHMNQLGYENIHPFLKQDPQLSETSQVKKLGISPKSTNGSFLLASVSRPCATTPKLLPHSWQIPAHQPRFRCPVFLLNHKPSQGESLSLTNVRSCNAVHCKCTVWLGAYAYT